MRTPADHLATQRKTLMFARSVPLNDYADKAGREAYLAGYQAVVAFILASTGATPKTHSGTRSEFARLARDEPRLGRKQIVFLGWSYELKTVADYGADQPVTAQEARRAISEAAELIEIVAMLIQQS